MASRPSESGAGRQAALSVRPGKDAYGPRDVREVRYDRDLGDPGRFPFTRGIHETMYRGRLWTMRQFAGFGTPAETNARFRFLLAHGQTGLSTAFDLPTLMGRDPDDPLSEGEVGRCGVSVASAADMARLFDRIPLGRVSVSMTINAPAAAIFAFYLAAARRRGVPLSRLRGTLQNDILKEYHAQNEFLYPPRPSVRLVVDAIRFCAARVPQWNPVSVSGYHIREAGSTAAQELAFTLGDGFAYVDACLAAGLDVDRFAPRLSFFFNSHLDFFEEVAKFRAARRIWAREMRGRYRARDPRSWRLRFHTQTAGCTLTRQQPMNNVVRTTLQALAGVLGGTQSLHTNSLDETLALPTEASAKLALRTQQIIALESEAAKVGDPLGGSWYVERLTGDLEREARDYFRRIAALGGMVRAAETGFVRSEIARSAYAFERDVEAKRRLIVGVNTLVEEEREPATLRIGARVERNQVRRIRTFRRRRRAAAARRALDGVRRAAEAPAAPLLEPLLSAAEAGATLGEITAALRDAWGAWEPAGSTA